MSNKFYFKDWIEFYGRTRLANDLRISKSTVDKWAQGNSNPRVHQMQKIKKISNGYVDYVHIIDGTEIENISCKAIPSEA